ncbi:MAG: hypothetical protein KJ634_03640 [Gammaproteobacteria bacterium]|nr:hypothetical protein [Gammaproteobacteria bacterium]MBU1414697.1 hypothetical protein [Gammaproteobacteria bacterium]
MNEKTILALATCILAGCASYGGHDLVIGEAGEADVIRTMGTPAMRWTQPDGGVRLAFPRGPMGVHTYMADIGADGKLSAIRNVLTPETFGEIAANMSADEVLRRLGPPEPSWTAYFSRRNELVWVWRYCDDWHQLARFDVLFDATARRVRSTMTQREDQIGDCGGEYGGGCWCSR